MPSSGRYHAETSGQPDFLDWLQRAQTHFGRFASDAGGVIMLALACMILLALFDQTDGRLLEPVANTFWRWLGWGSLFVILVMTIVGFSLLRRRNEGYIRWGRIIGI